MSAANPVIDLFKTEYIEGQTADEILERLGRWGVRNLAYNGVTGCNPGYIFRGELNYQIPLCSKLERAVNDRHQLRNKENERYRAFVESEDGQRLALDAVGRVHSRNEFWWWLALMQHYERPTRLIDFTPDIRVALFFALEHFEDKSSAEHCDAEKTLVIYCFPCRDLKHEFDGENNKSPFLPLPGGTDMNLALGWKIDPVWMEPHKENWHLNYAPISNRAKGWGWDRPAFSNPRLDAQRGMFVYPFDDPEIDQKNLRVSWFVETLLKNRSDPFHMKQYGPTATRLLISGKQAGLMRKHLEHNLSLTAARIYVNRNPKRYLAKTPIPTSFHS